MSRVSAAADVLEHRFGAGPELTVGVEEEFMLLDAESFDLVQRIEAFLRSEQRADDWGIAFEAEELIRADAEIAQVGRS